MEPADLEALIRTHGLAILMPIAVVEGPIVSVVAGYLSSLSLMSLRAVVPALVIADLIGDAGLYALGRYGRRAIPRRGWERVGLSRARIAQMVRGFRSNGARFLVAGKLTHGAGFAILTAAGVVRMPFGQFLLINLAATLPKTCALVALGWGFGAAWERLDGWILRGSLIVLVLALAGLALWFHFRRKEKP
jgi:membrane protein DedA with SNARE-associated domain